MSEKPGISLRTRVDQANERRRKKSEISAILQDLERLQTIPAERKKRWIWELLQNAKDEAPADKAVIIIRLTKTHLEFIHNGKPFNIDSLLALLTRTSTKPFSDGEENGPTGKYGTGFVTSHILNRVVDLEGMFENEQGLRPFQFQINRNVSVFNELKDALDIGFNLVDEIDRLPAFEKKINTTFRYQLTESLQVAIDSITEFADNLIFTLFINHDKIKSITVEDHIKGKSSHFEIYGTYDNCQRMGFVHIDPDRSDENNRLKGLLYWQEGKLTLAVPAIKSESGYQLTPIGLKSRLYKEFPLIGTEQAHIPYFVQSEMFLPPETRDGIRTSKSSEDFPDYTADNNRAAFVQFQRASIHFFEWLKEQKVKDLHLLAESGLPIEKLPYTGINWYLECIQQPLRHYFSALPLIKAISGKQISMLAAKIPQRFEDPLINKQFYDLAAMYNKDLFPDETSFCAWQYIIMQDSERWGIALIYSVSDLVQAVTQETLTLLFHNEEQKIAEWLDQLIQFCYTVGESKLCETNAIYLNREMQLRKRTELAVDSCLNQYFIEVADELEQRVSAQLLHSGITHNEGVAKFDIKSCYDKLNKYIGDLIPSPLTAERYPAVFRLITMFSDTIARERERWYHLSRNLLPNLTAEKQTVYDMNDYNWAPSEKASIRYVAWLVERSGDFQTFKTQYFEGEDANALKWLNSYIAVLFRNQDYEEYLVKYKVILMQDDCFAALSAEIFAEPEKEPFDDFFKKIYTTYSGQGDVRSILINRSIHHERLLSKALNSITDPVDRLFAPADAEKLVEQNGPLNLLFHDLNTFKPSSCEDMDKLFNTFSLKRASLYVRAFGPSVSNMLMKIHQMNRSFEDIEALVDLNMDAEELAVLKNAAQLAGGAAQLVALAQQIATNAADAAHRKEIGNAAEAAFREAINMVEPLFIENPDYGFDFEIKHKGKMQTYYLEIKSTVATKENIQMSSRQGITAKDNPLKYALCVLNRLNHDDIVTKEYFIEHARFLTTVGPLITPKVAGMESALANIRSLSPDEETGSMLDSEQYRVFVGKKAWNRGMNFDQFVQFIQTDFFK